MVVAVAAWIGQRLLRRAGLEDAVLIEPEPLALPAAGWGTPVRIKDLSETSGRWT